MLIEDYLIKRKELFVFGMLLVHADSINKVPKFICNNWSQFVLDDYMIYIHKSEKIQYLSFYDTQVYIIGDVHATNEYGTVQSLLEIFVKTKDWSILEDLSGRFNIIIFSPNEKIVFHDAFGSKTLYYSEFENNMIAANHAALLALTKDQDVSAEIDSYKNSKEYNSRGTKFLPGDITMFDSIYGLSPNNYLNIIKGKACRYYFYNDIKETTIEELKYYVYQYFKKQSEFINSEKYLPLLSLTGGVDARLAIAAFMHFKVDFELLTWSQGVSEAEFSLINRLADYINKRHTLIDTNKKVNDKSIKDIAFISEYNSSLSRGKSILTAQFKEAFPDESYIFIRGLGGEILRGMFNKSNNKHNVTNEMTNIEYTKHIYDTNSVRKIETTPEYHELTSKFINEFFDRSNLYNLDSVDIGDVIYWEQRMGRWAAELHNSNDAAMKNFASLNSRKLYRLAQGISSEKRFSRDLIVELIAVFDKNLAEIPYI